MQYSSYMACWKKIYQFMLTSNRFCFLVMLLSGRPNTFKFQQLPLILNLHSNATAPLNALLRLLNASFNWKPSMFATSFIAPTILSLVLSYFNFFSFFKQNVQRWEFMCKSGANKSHSPINHRITFSWISWW